MSSKTPKESAKKTKSGLKTPLLIVLAFGVLIFSFWVISQFYQTLRKENTTSAPQTDLLCLKTPPESSDCEALLYVADTPQERSKGLSGRESLPDDRGMVFIFDAPDEQCFWMKDTLIPLDMIWLDDSKTITKIEPNVQPSSYPDSFCSDKPEDKYVIELNAGKATELLLAVGRQISF